MRIKQFILLGTAILLFPAVASSQTERNPVYVGSNVCGSCHDGEGMGHQYSKWMLSKHARAYAVLSHPEARKIAELSGIPEEPQKAAVCLGCHATASEAEEWERDLTFRIEDGVQCEKCHGAGSEYMDADIMQDRDAAMRLGLRMSNQGDCKVCHYEKGSHVAVHNKPMLDLEEAMEQIAHPTPEHPKWKTRGFQSRAEPGSDEYDLVGSYQCGKCHDGPMMGFQFSRWKMSRHALAYASLSTPRAFEIAREEGVSGEPRTSGRCLVCHAPGFGQSAKDSYIIDEGVGCEACHGPGSEYQFEAVMLDSRAARQAGLQSPDEETCRKCHENAHGKTFEYQKSVASIAHPTDKLEVAESVRYKTPLNLAISPDSKEMYVACEASDSVIVIDVASQSKIDEIPVGGQPHDVTFSPDGRLAYVSNRLDDSVSVIDVRSRKVIRTAPVGDEPHGVLTDPTGRTLYVLNTSEDSISLLDTATMKEIKRLQASRAPWSLAMSPDGRTIHITNTLSRLVEFRKPSISEITILDVKRGIVTNRLEVEGGNLLQGIAWHPSGEFAFFTHTRTKNLVPMTRLLQGWTITNGIGVVWKDGTVDQLLLDESHLAFPDPADVTFTPDGKLALVTSSGSNRVAVVDVDRLIGMLKSATPKERREIIPNHLGKATDFVIKSINTEHSPRGILVTPDGKTAFAVNALDDSITAIDLQRLEAVRRIDLGGPKQITKTRFGEQVFHNAGVTFHRQFSCHTCHPDGHVDGVTYDIEPDGVGASPVDNRTLRGILDTAPFKWEGTNPSLQRQCGPRLAVFFTRIDPFTPEELSAVDNYIATIPRPPNRYRPLGAELTPAQRRGKKLFERMMTNDGRIIPRENRCITCHPPPLYTNHSVVDVGTKMQYDREGKFDVPHLNNIYDSAPYLHNGILIHWKRSGPSTTPTISTESRMI